jgi:hypothetical protein
VISLQPEFEEFGRLEYLVNTKKFGLFLMGFSANESKPEGRERLMSDTGDTKA